MLVMPRFPEVVPNHICTQIPRAHAVRYAGMMPVEEVDAEKFLELPHALADAGLANAKRLRAAAETAMLGDLHGLKDRSQFNFWVHRNPLKTLGSWLARKAVRPRVEKRFPQNKMWASSVRLLTIDERDAA